MKVSKTIKDRIKHDDLPPKHEPYKRSKATEQCQIERGDNDEDGQPGDYGK